MGHLTPIIPLEKSLPNTPPVDIRVPLTPRTRRPKKELDCKFVCPIPECTRRYALRNSLHQHLRKTHNIQFPASSRGRPRGSKAIPVNITPLIVDNPVQQSEEVYRSTNLSLDGCSSENSSYPMGWSASSNVNHPINDPSAATRTGFKKFNIWKQ